MRASVAWAAGAVLLLSGCTAHATEEPAPASAPVVSPVIAASSPATAPAEATCLTLDGDAIDWSSSVPCTGNHALDVVSVSEWPGMAEAVSESGAAAVFTQLTEGSVLAADYSAWAEETCRADIRAAAGWSDTAFADEFSGYAMLPASPFIAETTIAARQSFTAGEHRTVCTMRWWEALRYPDGVTVKDLGTAEFPRLARTCWREGDEGFMYFVACDGWHDAQSIIGFDLASAYGADALEERRVQQSLDAAAEDCVSLVDAVLPTLEVEAYDVWSLVPDDEAWGDLADGPAEPGIRYPVDCVVSRIDGSPVRGDLLSADVEVQAR